MTGADGSELLRRCQRGDEAAMRDLVLLYQERIFRLAFRVLQDAARAEDATADALAVVWLRSKSWREESQAGTWVYQVAWRVILDHHRALKRWWRFGELKSEAESIATSVVDSPVANAERAEAEQSVGKALEKLSAEDRALVHIHYYEQKSLAEIALILGVSRDALKMRLSRARQKLRSVLGEEYGSG